VAEWGESVDVIVQYALQTKIQKRGKIQNATKQCTDRLRNNGEEDQYFFCTIEFYFCKNAGRAATYCRVAQTAGFFIVRNHEKPFSDLYVCFR